MKNILITIFLFSLFACENRSEIEKAFITEENEYLTYYSQGQTGYLYFKFLENGNYDKYERDMRLFNNDGDLIEDNRNWSVSKDSIFTWGAHKYDVVSYNDKIIVLLYQQTPKSIPGYVFFVKQKDSQIRKGENFYEQKRIKNPNKYKSTWK